MRSLPCCIHIELARILSLTVVYPRDVMYVGWLSVDKTTRPRYQLGVGCFHNPIWCNG